MSIECHKSECLRHSSHFGGEGPFCEEEVCIELLEVPKRGSERWKEIVSIGCNYEYDVLNQDCDCGHGYMWVCDGCPVNIEKQIKRNL
jgi:hypothetical protein